MLSRPLALLIALSAGGTSPVGIRATGSRKVRVKKPRRQGGR